MQRATKILLSAGAVVSVIAIGAAGMAAARDGGWGHHGGWGGHGKHHGMHHRRGGGHGHMLRKMMERYDADGDKKLTQAEIDTGRKADIDKFDTDKDGKLSLKEYEDLWLDQRRRRMVRAFQFNDRDGDAAITLDEYNERTSGLVGRFDRSGDGALSRDDHGRRHGWRGRHRNKRGWNDDDAGNGRGMEQDDGPAGEKPGEE